MLGKQRVQANFDQYQFLLRATSPNIGAGLGGLSSKKVFQMIYYTFL